MLPSTRKSPFVTPARRRIVTALSAGIIAVLALSGCGEIETQNSGGMGSCDGHPATISSSQSADGRTFTLSYDGPDTATTLLAQGLPIEALGEMNSPINDNFTAYGEVDGVVELTEAKTRTVSGNGLTTHADFTGDLSHLFNGEPTPLDDPAVNGSNTPWVSQVTPVMIGIDCAGNTSGHFSSGADVAFGFTASTVIYPNHVVLSGIQLENQEVQSDGSVNGLLTVPESSALVLNGLDAVPLDGEFAVVYPDDPTIPNDSFGNLWNQTPAEALPSATMSVDGSRASENGGAYAFTLSAFDNTIAIPVGDYLLRLLMVSVDGRQAKVAFVAFHYDRQAGVTFSDLSLSKEATSLPTVEAASLANTGGNPGENLGAWIVALAILGAGFALWRTAQGRRRILA